MGKGKKSFNEIPRWNSLISHLPTEVKKCEEDIKRADGILKERVKFPWNLRESGFWLRLRGIKLYNDIKSIYFKQYDVEKAQEFLNELDVALDEWDGFISNILGKFEKSEKHKQWEGYILLRDNYKCKKCGATENLKIHCILTISELIGGDILKNSISIENVGIEQDNFYQVDNGITLCFKCFSMEDLFGDSQNWVNRWRIGSSVQKSLMEDRDKQEVHFKLANLKMEISNKLRDSDFKHREWFSEKLCEMKKLQFKFVESIDADASPNRFIEIQVLFRIGEYDLAKRLAIRQERWFRKFNEAREPHLIIKRKKRNNFASRNRETILIKTMDKLIELYKKGDYRIVYTSPEAQGIDDFKRLFREAENNIRQEFGVPLIGEGWITETEIFYLTKNILSGYEVVHHARPDWLEGQEFDIYVPELKLAIEYMGEQHYKPIDFFGGEEGFKNMQIRDEKKKNKTYQRGEKILYIRYDDSLDEKSLQEKIISLVRNRG